MCRIRKRLSSKPNQVLSKINNKSFQAFYENRYAEEQLSLPYSKKVEDNKSILQFNNPITKTNIKAEVSNTDLYEDDFEL